ncbi:GIY-YIG nuclease family protein [Gordonia tangerina]|uniref:GIY-YIG nuclease family protein n=1 Tax=Gordonia tangerina TaxID=2911060 RepID=A0ABS9DNR5_9ACTN|nr:GIY-YIG nuclease family protein [Gordonia tangerina]MCF3939914.1 GIY-YIG nuclease family protein [Gordonia tangerina]
MTGQVEAEHPCCWPECDGKALVQDRVEEWYLCFTHTAIATEFVDRTALGLKAGDPMPPRADGRRRSTRSRAQARNEQRGDRPGWVYYARVGEHIKIGYATNVRNRMQQYPPGTVLLAVEPGDLKLEKARHKEFNHSLVFGQEWFRESYPIKKLVDELREKHGSDLADIGRTNRRSTNTDTLKPRWSSRRSYKA